MLSSGTKECIQREARAPWDIILDVQSVWVKYKLKIVSHIKIIGICGWYIQIRASYYRNHSKKQSVILVVESQNRLGSQQISLYLNKSHCLLEQVIKSLWKKSFGNKYYVNPGIQCFRLINKVRFPSLHTRVTASRIPAKQEAAHRSEGLYLLQPAALSKREFKTDLISGDTAILWDRSPWFCLVIGRVR